jgi:hypothetical protein
MDGLFGLKKTQNKMFVFFICILFIFNSCQVKKIDNEIIFYKYFDEYQMKGLFEINDINNYKGKYFVSVVSFKDSLVLRKMQKDKLIEKAVYLNKNGNWEISIKDEKLGNNKTFKYITYHHKKIISQDTIFNYSYNLIDGNYASGCISYSTKQNSFFCYDCGVSDIRNKFNNEIAKNYINKCDNKEFFYKKYKKNRMFIYNEDGTLNDVRSFYFGYFDSDEKLNESFIDEYPRNQ